MAETVKGILIRLGLDGTELYSGLQKVDKNLSGTQSKINVLKKSLKEDWDMDKFTRAQELARTRVEEIGNRIEILKQALKEAESRAEKGIENASEYASKLQLELDKAELSAQRAKKQLDEINNLQFTRAKAEINSLISSTQSRIDTLKQSLEENWSMDKFNQAQSLAQNQIKQTTEKVELLKKAISEMENQGVDKASADFQELQHELDKAEVSAQRAKRQFDEINSMQFTRAKSQVDSFINSTQSSIDALKQSLEGNWSMDKFNRAQALSREQIDQTAKKVNILKKAISEMEKQGVDETSDEFRELRQELDEAELAAQRAKKQFAEISALKLDRLSASLDGISQKLGNIAQKTAPLSAAAAAGLTLSAKAAMDYEHAFTGVRKTVDATDEELATLNADLREMATTIPVSAVDLAELAGVAGQLGIQTENITSFTRTIADLGVASNLAGEEGASMLAKFANVAQTPQDQFSRLGSTIVDLGNNSATTERDIMEMGMRLVGAGAQAGMAESDILGMAAALSSVGLEAEAGGSAFSKVINEINIAVQTGSKELDQYANVAGMTADEFKQAFEQDAANAVIAFVEGLQESGDDAVTILQDMEITEVRMRDALLRSAGAGDILRESIDLASNAWINNTALTEEAERAYGDTYNQLQITKNQLVDAAIDIGEMLLPVIRDLAEDVRGAVQWFTNLDQSTQQTIVKIVALAAVISPMMSALSGLVGGLKNIVVGLRSFKAANDAATVSQTALNLAMTSNPVGWVILALGAVVTALVGFSSKTEEAKEYTDDLNVSLRQQGEDLNNLAEQYDNSKQQLEKETAAIESQNVTIRESVKRLEELSGKTQKTAQEKAEMKRIIDELNKVMPDLNLAMNNETGTLNVQIGTVWKAVDAWYALARAKAAANQYNLAVEQQLIAKKNREDVINAVDPDLAQRVANVALAEHNGSIPSFKKALADNGFRTQEEYEQAKAAMQQANSNYDAALAQEQEANEDVAYWENERQQYQAEADQLTGGLNLPPDDDDKNYFRGGGSGGGGRSGSSASSAAEDAREARVEAYQQNIEDTEDWNLNYYEDLKNQGKLTREQELKSMQDRADRYRKYAADVLNQDYMTAEERRKLNQKYLEEAKSWDQEALELQEDINKEKADQYKADIEERERLDLRNQEHKKALDQLTAEEEEKMIADRAQRYRQYADEVLQLDFLTEEEKQALRQQYLEKAEDTEVELYQFQKNMAEERRQLREQEMQDALQMLEEMKQREMTAMQQAFDAERQYLQESENAEIESIQRRAKEQEELLQQKLDAIDEEIEARRRLREDEEQEDKLATIRKQIAATQAELSYARDDDTRENLQRELARQQAELEKELQNQADTEFERQKQAEKDAINEQIEEIRKRAEAEQEAVRNRYEGLIQDSEQRQAAKEQTIQENADRYANAAPVIFQTESSDTVVNNDNRQGTLIVQQVQNPAQLAKWLNKVFASQGGDRA